MARWILAALTVCTTACEGDEEPCDFGDEGCQCTDDEGLECDNTADDAPLDCICFLVDTIVS
ncbi:MAG: hypothetical protein KTR31_19130 [Myxococcales bacterium]|nr:hypothetical protein [Myxococcales bacterium]